MRRMLTRHKTGLCLAVCGMLAMTACINETVYHHFCSVPTNGWSRNDTLTFEPELNDSLNPIELALEVRHTDRYPYQDLWLSVAQNLTDSNTWQRDTVRLSLSSPDGTWKGTGASMNLYVCSNPYKTLYPQQTGKRTIRICPVMNDSLLRHITDIGILIRRK